MGFAFTNLLLKKHAASATAARALAMFLGGALLPAALALGLAPFGLVAGIPAFSWTWMLPLAMLTLAFVAANMALQFGAARLPARITALVMLSELVFAVLQQSPCRLEFLDQCLEPFLYRGRRFHLENRRIQDGEQRLFRAVQRGRGQSAQSLDHLELLDRFQQSRSAFHTAQRFDSLVQGDANTSGALVNTLGDCNLFLASEERSFAE